MSSLTPKLASSARAGRFTRARRAARSPRVATAALAGGLTLLAMLWGCDNDRFDLAPATSSTGTSAGGSGAGGSGGGGASSGHTGSGGAGGGFNEPAGATTLTMVNGLVDYPAMRFCMLPYPDGGGSEQPWPSSDLPFAEAAVETDISALIAPGQDIEVVGLTGDLTTLGGAGCAQLMAQPPQGLVVSSFGVLPASAFEQDRDLLLVTSGCLGGPGHADLSQSLICGLAYNEQTPTAAMVAGFMSRLIEPDKVSMQFVHGSVALPSATLRVRPGQETGTAVLAQTNWAWGSVAPYPPFDNFTLANLGTVGNARIELTQTMNSQQMADIPFASAFFNSNVLETEDVQDGEGFVFVTVGPSSGVPPGSWWNGFKVTVVRADPGGSQ